MSDTNATDNLNGSGDTHSGGREATAKFQRDELVRGWREYEEKMPRIIPLIKHAAKTDMGQVRENNEDKFDFYEPEVPSVLAARGCFYAVADGVGGALAGQIASELMLKTLVYNYYNHPAPDVETALHEAIVEANSKVYSLAQMIPERSGMGTTLTAAVFIEDRVVVAQVGDSRCYLLRDGMAHQITRDHSWVEEQVRAGIMTRNDAETSPFRNVITRSIGAAAMVQPDFFIEQVRVGDLFVLCSDGLTGHVHDEEMTRIVTKQSPSEAARQLIELANAHGGRDNITVFVLSVRDLLAVPTHMPVSASEQAAPAPDNSAASRAAVVQEALVTPQAPAVKMQPAAAGGPSVADIAAAPPTKEPERSGWRRLWGR